MYSQITSNKRKSVILLLVFVVVVLGFGWLIGEYYQGGLGFEGVTIAGIISIFMSLGSYFHGDKLALATSGAKNITVQTNPYVFRMVENLAITAGIPCPKVYIIEDQAINAFATGRNPQHASIAVTTGAIEKLKNEELEGVLAHELSHVKNYDILVMTLVIVLVGTVALLSDWMFRGSMFRSRERSGREGNQLIAVLAIVAIILAPIISQLIKLAVSRKREYLADASGALLTRYPEGLANALEKIRTEPKAMDRANHATAHLFLSDPFRKQISKKVSNLWSTHPPLEDRIKALHEMGI